MTSRRRLIDGFDTVADDNNIVISQPLRRGIQRRLVDEFDAAPTSGGRGPLPLPRVELAGDRRMRQLQKLYESGYSFPDNNGGGNATRKTAAVVNEAYCQRFPAEAECGGGNASAFDMQFDEGKECFDEAMVADVSVQEYIDETLSESESDDVPLLIAYSNSGDPRAPVSMSCKTKHQIQKFGLNDLDKVLLECGTVDSMQDVRTDREYVKLTMGAQNLVVPMTDVRHMLASKTEWVFLLRPTNQTLAATVSLNVYSEGADMASASHCQRGTQERVYGLFPVHIDWHGMSMQQLNARMQQEVAKVRPFRFESFTEEEEAEGEVFHIFKAVPTADYEGRFPNSTFKGMDIMLEGTHSELSYGIDFQEQLASSTEVEFLESAFTQMTCRFLAKLATTHALTSAKAVFLETNQSSLRLAQRLGGKPDWCGEEEGEGGLLCITFDLAHIMNMCGGGGDGGSPPI